jgi:hypothetical protein
LQQLERSIESCCAEQFACWTVRLKMWLSALAPPYLANNICTWLCQIIMYVFGPQIWQWKLVFKQLNTRSNSNTLNIPPGRKLNVQSMRFNDFVNFVKRGIYSVS